MRIAEKGIYLLDELKASLSLLKQLSLMSFIMEVSKSNYTQFIIPTHSPVLMGLPGACIYEIKETGMQRVNYKDTNHYRITKNFLYNPHHYMKHL